MITYLFMINNDIYKFFHLGKSPQKQNFLNVSQGTSHTSGHLTHQDMYNHVPLLRRNLC